MEKFNISGSFFIVFLIIAFLAGFFIGKENKNEDNNLSLTEEIFLEDSLSVFKKDSILNLKQKDTVIIPQGGSLVKNLGMSEEEAYAFSQKFNLKDKFKMGKYIVIIYPGDTFIKTWMPIRYPKN